MSASVEQRLQDLIDHNMASMLAEGKIGLEKECLRVGLDGHIAQTPHPKALGSALTHPSITTDYSEAMLEFVTPPFGDARESAQFLQDAQQFTYRKLQNELLWATSMPCMVEGDTKIPVGRYGSSNAGKMKTAYRMGLGHRYGRKMQVIAGVHFNYSVSESLWPALAELDKYQGELQDFISAKYFGMIRNVRRNGWLIPYLFGTSPAVCKSFFGGDSDGLQSFAPGTAYLPYATSLRMSDIGYRNTKTRFPVSYDNVADYAHDLGNAIATPHDEYEALGVKANGHYRQLNANLLQIENEYYSSARPKQIPEHNEMPSLALLRRGVRYLELRSVDVSAFDPLGVNLPQLRFLEAFMLYCLLDTSPPIVQGEECAIDFNHGRAASEGRDPALKLRMGDREVPLRECAEEILRSMEGTVEVLDRAHGGTEYRDSLAAQHESVAQPDATPSATMLRQMRENGEEFYHFALRMSKTHQQHFLDLDLNPEREAFFANAAAVSQKKQAQIEASDEISFDEYLQDYFAQSKHMTA